MDKKNFEFGHFFVESDNGVNKLFLEFNNGASVLVATGDSLNDLENVILRLGSILQKCFELIGLDPSPLEVCDEIKWQKSDSVQRSQDLYFGYFEISELLSEKRSKFELSVAFKDEKVLFDSFDSKEMAEKMAEGINRAVSFC